MTLVSGLKYRRPLSAISGLASEHVLGLLSQIRVDIAQGPIRFTNRLLVSEVYAEFHYVRVGAGVKGAQFGGRVSFREIFS